MVTLEQNLYWAIWDLTTSYCCLIMGDVGATSLGAKRLGSTLRAYYKRKVYLRWDMYYNYLSGQM